MTPNQTRRTLLGAFALLVAGRASATAQKDAGGEIELVARQGRAVGGIKVVRLKRGDTVALRIDSDAADEVHVHGYDLHAPVAPGKPASLRFVAKRTGRFAVELHRADVELGVLEIYPK